MFMIQGNALAPAWAECTEATFAKAVDKFGVTLRNYNAEAQPRMRARLTMLAEKKGWTGEDREERAMLYLEDGRLGELDTRANELLSKVDQLGQPNKDGTYDCSKLAEIEAASIEMLAVMKTKAAYLDDKVAREVGSNSQASSSPASPAAPTASSPPAVAKIEPAPVKPAGSGQARAPEPAKVAAVPPPKPKPTEPRAVAPVRPDGIWEPQSKSVVPKSSAGGAAIATAPIPPTGDTNTLPPVTFDSPDQGYTIDEIREASRGFFGAVSTNLASVIEYAFASSGRPSGYILGTEGGGAFLAGLRYGKGTLYLRQGGTRPIHWHGPSVGYDIGAEGGRTLILVYSMRDPEQLYRSFTGIAGSAYLVGGAGMTLLKGGDVIMAPIRSGLGLRIGANIGYLRFTSQPTWNPF
jgi:hypothetical protein